MPYAQILANGSDLCETQSNIELTSAAWFAWSVIWQPIYCTAERKVNPAVKFQSGRSCILPDTETGRKQEGKGRMAMATKQADRLEERFRLWDNTSNGYIERADFEREADEIIARLDAQGSPKAQQLKQTYLDMFDQLARVAGTDRMSRADFLRVCEQEIIDKGDEGFAAMVRPTIQAIVNVLDRSGDGEISPVEMQAWFAAIGLEGDVADRAFGELDTNG